MLPNSLELINETIQRAVRLSPYYAETYKGLDLKVTSLADLRRFPLLSREVLVHRGEDLVARGDLPVTVSMTGGTTFGPGGARRPLLIFRSAEEAQVRRELLAALQGQSQPRPLLLYLVNLGHGFDPEGGREGCFQLPLERPFHWEAILDLLRREFSFLGYTPRVRAMAGPLRMLKALTLLCMERDVDPGDFAVEVVSSSSNHLTSRWRSLLEGYWRAVVDDAYGLSEVPGLHARRCASCGHFHFSPLAIPEVLRLDGGEPVERGIGRLVATSLYPLAAMEPIIRYDTGDVLEVIGECPAGRTFGFEFLGRLSQAVTLPEAEGPRLVLSPIALNEVLDSVPDIACQEFAFTRSLGLRSTVGLQKWGVRTSPSGEVTRVELALELRWSPWEYPAACGRLKEELTARVLAAAPALAAAVDAGEIDFRITCHEPGATDLKALV